jgi:hypothetical protein
MRTNTPIYPENIQAQQSDDYDPTLVNLSSPPAGMFLVSQGAAAIDVRPGDGVIVNQVFRVREFIRISGQLALPLPAKPLTALFFRNDTGQGQFPRVVSLQTQLRQDGSFEAQIDKMRYANLLPGFYIVGLRNPKANPTITLQSVTVTFQ